MAQPLKAGQRLQSHNDSMRERLNGTMACDVLNRVIAGDDVPEQQARYSFAVVNKLLPSLQAVAMELHAQVSTNMADLMLQAQQLGMSEADLFSTPETKQLILQEKVDSAEVIDEEGVPPDEAA